VFKNRRKFHGVVRITLVCFICFLGFVIWNFNKSMNFQYSKSPLGITKAWSFGPGFLFSGHGRSTLGTFLLITRTSRLMGCSFTAVGADAKSTRTRPQTTSPAATGTSPLSLSCSRSLAFEACSISFWHFICLLLGLSFF
jgi:hypothetical protein